jgi:hypothetical protein
VAIALATLTVLGGLTACSSPADTEELQVGDCLQVGGTVDIPEAEAVPCGSPESNFKVISKVTGDQICPADADSSYSLREAFSSSATTACLDIDWVVGGCMSVDPEHASDPFRVDCDDTRVPNRQRATQILNGVASADQCTSGQGYAYGHRQFTVCVENMA